MCTFGGLLSYQSSLGMRPTKAPSNLRILLINTRVSRNTKAMVERVRARACALPKITARILESMDLISISCLETLSKLRRSDKVEVNDDHFGILEELIDTNQGLLASLGVSHPSLERVISIAAGRGLHAKLTGAGGGGFAFALLPPATEADTVDAVKAEMKEAGFHCWETSIGGCGFLAESTDVQ